jgi:hypothetical protein
MKAAGWSEIARSVDVPELRSYPVWETNGRVLLRLDPDT